MARDIWSERFTNDATSPIPLDRWDADGPLATSLFGRSDPPLRFGVFLRDDGSNFDAAAFGISGPEAALMDPQQRLLLETVGEALLQQGSTGSGRVTGSGSNSSHGSNASEALGSYGVFVGVSSMDYQKLASRYEGGITAYSATGVALSVAAGRLSYAFGLRGPALAIDTACSSSLVGAHTAALSLKAGHCAYAAACGVNLILYPDTPAMFKRAGMLAEDGRCKVLDTAADGYVRAEACGALVLAAKAAGVQGGATPLALMLGTAVGQDGRSSSLTGGRCNLCCPAGWTAV